MRQSAARLFKSKLAGLPLGIGLAIFLVTGCWFTENPKSRTSV
jgi:hypothetical protein